MLAGNKVPSTTELRETIRARRDDDRKANNLLNDLITNNIIFVEDWNELDVEVRDDLSWIEDSEDLMRRLVDLNLLTQYQADRILAGTRFGLILGNYRILERLGAGGMGIVFKGEHFIMRRQAAIKVLPFRGKQDEHLLRRFRSELRTVASLNHPNIVSAFDGGVEFSGDNSYPDIYYFVMEYINGEDLESLVARKKTLSIHESIDIIYQITLAIEEAWKHGLVHRDIKPSNVMITKNGVAKLLDFGLVRRSGHAAMTDPGTVLGTFDYLAPEQAKDASKVDIRADIYSLGATLYYCLAGTCPFPQPANKTINLLARLGQEPPSVRAVRIEVPEQLDHTIRKMMATRPEHRYQDPFSVLQALYPFTLTHPAQEFRSGTYPALPKKARSPGGSSEERRTFRVLLVDDDQEILHFMKTILTGLKIEIVTANRPSEALEKAQGAPFDLLITDVEMSEMSGPQLASQMVALPEQANLKAIIISGAYSEDQMAGFLGDHVLDIVRKPFSKQLLISRVKNAIYTITKYSEASRMIQMLVKINDELEQSYQNTVKSSIRNRSLILQSFMKMVEKKVHEPSAHTHRVRLYSRRIAVAAAETGDFAELAEANYIEHLENAAMFHDVGKISLSDHLLNKEGVYTDEERIMMQEHTTTGAMILQDIMKKYSDEMPFLPVAIDVARHHHERFNGSGYPDMLSGDAIPLAARIVALADVYDALRCERTYRPAISHASAVRIMTTCSDGLFDPKLLRVFCKVADEILEIFQKNQ